MVDVNTRRYRTLPPCDELGGDHTGMLLTGPQLGGGLDPHLLPRRAWRLTTCAASNGLDRENLGFLLAKASQRWNELWARTRQAGFPEVSPAFGSILLPLSEEDGLGITELGQRAGLSKQTMTTMIRLIRKEGWWNARPDPLDRRAARICLAEGSRTFKEVAAQAL